MQDASRVRVMDAASIDRSITRMAHEILERHKGLSGIGLVGVQTRGVPLARRLAAKLAAIEGAPPPVGVLDINLYRDDLSRIAEHPVLRRTEIPFAVDGATVILVDDVLYTGRTVRAALDALIDLGRPRAIELAVLVDRGGRELPIQPDYVALVERNVPITHRVKVKLTERDGADEIVIDPRNAG